MTNVLIIEDDEKLLASLAAYLKNQRFVVQTSSNGEDGLYWLTRQSFDVAIVDWELPDLSGIEICQKYRKAGGTIPILMLTGRSSTADKLQGFDSGTDDYLAKPFEPAELFVRLRALIRRAGNYQSDKLHIEDIELDLSSRIVKRSAQSVKLSKTEFEVLALLMKNPGRTFTPDQIIERVWGNESDATEVSLRSHIARIRSKLEDAGNGKPTPLKTLYGMGYKIEI